VVFSQDLPKKDLLQHILAYIRTNPFLLSRKGRFGEWALRSYFHPSFPWGSAGVHIIIAQRARLL